MKFSRILFAVAFACAFAACAGEKARNVEMAEGLAFDSIVVDTISHITADTASPTIEVHLSIVYAKGENSAFVNDSIVKSRLLGTDFLPQGDSIKDVSQAIRMFTDNFVSSYKKDYSEMYANDKEHDWMYTVTYECNTRVTNEKAGVVNYIAEIYQYSGGAHGWYSTNVYNIDTKTGKRITLDDIFVPGYKPELTDIIVEKLCDEYDAKTLEQLQTEKLVFMSGDPYPTDNFILKEDGIEFVYVCMEIAPYAMGEIRVEVSNSEIEKLLNKNGKDI